MQLGGEYLAQRWVAGVYVKEPLSERIARNVEIDASGCWIWTAALCRAGYGKIQVDGRKCKAHRVAYEVHVGPIPEGLQIDHLCRNRACCNPAHLEPVTCKENIRRIGPRRHREREKTHCKNGHEFTEANTHVDHTRNGRRSCRACGRAKNWRRRGKCPA